MILRFYVTVPVQWAARWVSSECMRLPKAVHTWDVSARTWMKRHLEWNTLCCFPDGLMSLRWRHTLSRKLTPTSLLPHNSLTRSAFPDRAAAIKSSPWGLHLNRGTINRRWRTSCAVEPRNAAGYEDVMWRWYSGGKCHEWCCAERIMNGVANRNNVLVAGHTKIHCCRSL